VVLESLPRVPQKQQHDTRLLPKTCTKLLRGNKGPLDQERDKPGAHHLEQLPFQVVRLQRVEDQPLLLLPLQVLLLLPALVAAEAG